MVIDGFTLFLVIVTTICVGSGAWQALLTGLCVLFSGLLAVQLFEPLAIVIARQFSVSDSWDFRLDFLCYFGVFLLSLLASTWVIQKIAPTKMPLPNGFDWVLRWGMGLGTGLLTAAIVLTGLHLASLPRLVTEDEIQEPFGLESERVLTSPFAMEVYWLDFCQKMSETSLAHGGYKYRTFDGPIYSSGGDVGHWSSLPIRYADRRERMTRSRLGGSE